MGREREARCDSEVAAAAAATGPEEIRVPLGVARPYHPVGRDHREAPDVVASQAELAAGEPDAPTEREAGDTHGRARAARDREAVRGEFAVDVHQPGARAEPHRP